MAIKIQSYYKTTDITEEQLKSALHNCASQEYEIYKIFQTYGTLTTWDVVDVYHAISSPIQYTSAGRSINHLKNNGVVKEIGSIPGPLGRPVILYTITDNPPSEIKTYNKSLPKSISVDVILDDNGQIDVEKMIDDLVEKVVSLTEKYNI